MVSDTSADLASLFDTVFLSLGSNLGNRKMNMFSALAELTALLNCEEIEISPIFETQAWGNPNQPDYLNCVAKLTFSNLQQKSLVNTEHRHAYLERFLKDIKHIEDICGRVPSVQKWSARTIDIDILLYNDICYQSPQLTIPHKHMLDRKFVLIPLNVIASDLTVPGVGISVKKLLEKCSDQSQVSLYQSNLKSDSKMLSNRVCE